MAISSGLLSTQTNEWETPQWLFDELNAEFGFTLDPCATAANAKCEQFFTAEDDGLAQAWHGAAFVNPPYGREISKWVKKSWEESRRGCVVVMLIASRTDTRYWHDYVMQADEIRFIRGRLHFSLGGKVGDSTPFPSAVIVFRGGGGPPKTRSLKSRSKNRGGGRGDFRAENQRRSDEH